ncbi:MAG: 2-octaprenyl-6-methoxyphenyl hydroxylase [Gammaproteobacteria bacterium]|nr:2-octaprenyl-6-methoxyphenyl hydroxylase [Gammaproteobacteria bacterium]
MSSKTDCNYDVIIIGGGMVGASLACALSNQKHKRIAIVEAVPFKSDSQPSFDDRVIALSYGSRRILESMDLWHELENLIQPIESIHVSDRGHLGATRLHHSEEHVEALGYVAENRVIGQVMMNRLQQLDHIDLICPASIEQLQQANQSVDVVLNINGEKKQLTTKLLVAADGAMSRVRELAGLQTQQQDYGQTAVITNVETEYAHQNVAYERFTDTGPLAFLPMTKKRCSVVWTIDAKDSEQIMSLSDDLFIEKLQQRFGFRLGHILKAGVRNAYPLAYIETEQLVKGRVAIIGNAAHALHPVSGQGYNLALRDVAEIAELIATADDPGHELLLAEYHVKRRKDMQRVYRFTDTLVKVFSNNLSPLAHARAAGLILMDLTPSLRHLMARQSMGLLGRMGKMMRRISL